MHKFNKSLFVFRRDLRLSDNTALMAALKESQWVIPAFIFNPQQIEKNPYRSDNALQFMLESLKDLDSQLRQKGSSLYIFYGKPEKIIEDLIKEQGIEAVYTNRDYTPFSIHRDLSIEDICQKHRIKFFSFHDYLLTDPDQVKKNDGGVYTVFTPFFNKVRQKDIALPVRNSYRNFYSQHVSRQDNDRLDSLLKSKNKDIFLKGGRKEALSLLNNLKNLSAYSEERNTPSVKGTTGLSAHHKFGTVSIREVYHQVKSVLGESHQLINEIYWRDFFTHVGYHYPQVLGSCFKEKYNKIKWKDDKALFSRWCEGTTGFPIVDAGMRELNTTGFMHNRVRMVVASFLVKDLHINWQWGEKYFAQKLIDYDPLVNNGNWQWAASTGCDAQPYFRIFNPWLQQAKYDPQCRYIYKWVGELKNVAVKTIHHLYETSWKIDGYPQPIVDHKKQSKDAVVMFKEIN